MWIDRTLQFLKLQYIVPFIYLPILLFFLVLLQILRSLGPDMYSPILILFSILSYI
jgi:hypothetical protein